MANKPLPTAEELRQLLDYDPGTGALRWRERSADWFKDGFRTAQGEANNWNAKYAGKIAGTVSPIGYRYVALPGGRRVPEHRVIWAMLHDQWPKIIDHLDGDKLNNRSVNLRDGSQHDNLRNASRWSHNKSGVTGVCFASRPQRWIATIKVKQQNIYLGSSASFDEAVAIRREAEKRYGFSNRHGR